MDIVGRLMDGDDKMMVTLLHAPEKRASVMKRFST
jgi:hypothetical protein